MTDLEKAMLEKAGITEKEVKPHDPLADLSAKVDALDKPITDEIGNVYKQVIQTDGTIVLKLIESYSGELFE